MIWVAPSFSPQHRRALARLNEERGGVKLYRGVRITVRRINSWLRGVCFSGVEPHHDGWFVKRVHLFVDTGEWRLNDALLNALVRDQGIGSDFAPLGWEWDRIYSQRENQRQLSGWEDPSGDLQRLSTIEADKIGLLTPLLPRLELVFQETKSHIREQEEDLERLIREWRFRDCCCNWCCRQCPSETHVCRDCFCKWCVFDMAFSTPGWRKSSPSWKRSRSWQR